MSALAAALRVVLRDPNLSSAATYRRRGTTTCRDVRVVLKAPDTTDPIIAAGMVTPDAEATMAIGDIDDVGEGDVLVARGETYTVLARRRNTHGTAWRMALRRVPEESVAATRLATEAGL